MTRSYQYWKQSEIDYLASNYNIMSIDAIASHLTRDKNKVISQAKKHGLQESKGKRWTEIEDNFLTINWVTTPREEICKRLDRSRASVDHRAIVLGLVAPRGRVWEVEERAVLDKWAGKSNITKIKHLLDKVWDKHGWSRRSRTAIARQIYKMGESVIGEQVSVNQLIACLHCDQSSVKRWLAVPAYKEILKPVTDAKATWFEPRNLRKFMIDYPGEIARFHPDILWLIRFLNP